MRITWVFFFFIMFSEKIVAQSEFRMKIQENDTTHVNNRDIYYQFHAIEKKVFYQGFDISSYFKKKKEQNHFIFINPSRSNNFNFKQEYFNAELPGLGASKWFNNQFNWKAWNNLNLGLETGLVIQNTVFDPFIPNYQYTLGISVEYDFNKRLSAYVFSRYVSAPLNKPKDYFDPLLYNNSLFLQSESGFGLKSSFKNTLIDFRISSGYNQQLKSTNSFNSKLNIKF